MITAEAIVEINYQLIGEYAVLNKSAIDLAVSSYLYYETIELGICSIVRGLLKNHPFVDGNKRVAVAVLYILCEKFNISHKLSIDETAKVFMKIAGGNFDVEEICKMIFRK